jgi:DNA-binding MarR family transcriptional regulator
MVVIDELKFLSTIQKLEVVDIQQLANYLGMKYLTTAKRLERYQQREWIEFYKVDDRRRCLSPAGAKYLDYLRKRQEDNDGHGS